MPNPLDADLIARAVDGDDDALEQLLRSVTSEMRSWIDIGPVWQRSLDAEDIVQVSSLEAFLRIGSLREPTPIAFRAWMKRIVTNNLRDAIRGLERDKRPDPRDRITQGAGGETSRTLLASILGSDATASAPAQLAEEIERLRRAIEGLPKSYRYVVQHLDLEERDVAEVQEALGRSRGAIHLLRSRAHDRLRELLGN